MLGSILVFMTTFWNKKLNTHPYKLVSAIALIDATFFLIFNTIDETCNLELYKIFSATVFFSLEPERLQPNAPSAYMAKSSFRIFGSDSVAPPGPGTITV